MFWTSCVSNLFTQEKAERRLACSRNPYPGLHRQPLSKFLNFICALALSPSCCWMTCHILTWFCVRGCFQPFRLEGEEDSCLFMFSILFPSQASPYKHAIANSSPKPETITPDRCSSIFRRKVHSWSQTNTEFETMNELSF